MYLFSVITKIIVSVLRMLVIGLISFLFCIYTVDFLLNPKLGIDNLVIIIMYFSFVPVFFVVFIELFFYLYKKEKRNYHLNKEKEIYELE